MMVKCRLKLCKCIQVNVEKRVSNVEVQTELSIFDIDNCIKNGQLFDLKTSKCYFPKNHLVTDIGKLQNKNEEKVESISTNKNGNKIVDIELKKSVENPENISDNKPEKCCKRKKIKKTKIPKTSNKDKLRELNKKEIVNNQFIKNNKGNIVLKNKTTKRKCIKLNNDSINENHISFKKSLITATSSLSIFTNPPPFSSLPLSLSPPSLLSPPKLFCPPKILFPPPLLSPPPSLISFQTASSEPLPLSSPLLESSPTKLSSPTKISLSEKFSLSQNSLSSKKLPSTKRLSKKSLSPNKLLYLKPSSLSKSLPLPSQYEIHSRKKQTKNYLASGILKNQVSGSSGDDRVVM